MVQNCSRDILHSVYKTVRRLSLATQKTRPRTEQRVVHVGAQKGGAADYSHGYIESSVAQVSVSASAAAAVTRSDEWWL